MVGAAPSFGEVHLARTLFLLSEKPVGRKRLVKLLGVGEGSVRTIIKKLSSKGFLLSSKQGHSLSRKGAGEVRRILGCFARPVEFHSTDVPGPKQSLVVVREAADRIRKIGVDERDVAVRAGASGSVIMVFKEGKVGFPSDHFDAGKFKDLEAKLASITLTENDVVVISFADSSTSAEDGALAVALALSDLKLA